MSCRTPVRTLLLIALFATAAPAAVPGAPAPANDRPRLLQYASPKDIPAAERAGIFSEYVHAYRTAMQAGDFARAHELATHATRVVPKARRTWTHLAGARLRLAQWSPAIEAARQAETLRDDTDPPSPTPDESAAGAAYWEGVALYATQRYPEALARLRAARERAPAWAEGARALAECLFVTGDGQAAAREYAAAFALDPDAGTPRDLSYFAEAQAANGDLSGGVAAVQEALRRAPFEPGLHAKLGDLYRREHRLSDAYYALLYEVTLHGLESPFARATVSMQDEVARAAQEKHAGHDHSPSAAQAGDRMQADAHEIISIVNGLQALDRGATHRAARFFEHALVGTRSNSPMPHVLYADALLRDKQPDKAEGVLQLLRCGSWRRPNVRRVARRRRKPRRRASRPCIPPTGG
jgi:tetratricopeptide (TPR) repeat protein